MAGLLKKIAFMRTHKFDIQQLADHLYNRATDGSLDGKAIFKMLGLNRIPSQIMDTRGQLAMVIQRAPDGEFNVTEY